MMNAALFSIKAHSSFHLIRDFKQIRPQHSHPPLATLSKKLIAAFRLRAPDLWSTAAVLSVTLQVDTLLHLIAAQGRARVKSPFMNADSA